MPYASPTVAPQVLAAETKAERALWIEALQAQRADGSGPSPAATADEAACRAEGARLSETAALREGDAAALETPAELAEAEEEGSRSRTLAVTPNPNPGRDPAP